MSVVDQVEGGGADEPRPFFFFFSLGFTSNIVFSSPNDNQDGAYHYITDHYQSHHEHHFSTACWAVCNIAPSSLGQSYLVYPLAEEEASSSFKSGLVSSVMQIDSKHIWRVTTLSFLVRLKGSNKDGQLFFCADRQSMLILNQKKERQKTLGSR
jgi:hypothetical protein